MKSWRIVLPTLVLTVSMPLVSLASCSKTEQEITFENDSWENVCTYANMGLDALKEHYHVDSFIGKEKTVYLNIIDTQYKHSLVVIDENKDIKTDGKKCALTLQFKNIVGGNNPFRIWLGTFDRESTTWPKSNVRVGIDAAMKKYLPQIVYNNVKTVCKKSLNFLGDDVEESEETFFLPSMNEIWGKDLIKTAWYADMTKEAYIQKDISNPQIYSLENEQYALYKQIITKETGTKQDSTVKKTIPFFWDGIEYPRVYWLRTKEGRTIFNDSYYYFVDEEGKVKRPPTIYQTCTIVPIFCI